MEASSKMIIWHLLIMDVRTKKVEQSIIKKRYNLVQQIAETHCGKSLEWESTDNTTSASANNKTYTITKLKLTINITNI